MGLLRLIFVECALTLNVFAVNLQMDFEYFYFLFICRWSCSTRPQVQPNLLQDRLAKLSVSGHICSAKKLILGPTDS